MRRSIFLKMFILGACVFSASAFELVWENMVHDELSDTLTVTCSYNTNQYVLAESLQAVFLPNKERVSNIIFGEQPAEMYTPVFAKPVLVLHGKGTIHFIGIELEDVVDAVQLFYTTYDAAQKREGARTSLVVRALNSPQSEEIREFSEDLFQDGEEKVEKTQKKDDDFLVQDQTKIERPIQESTFSRALASLNKKIQGEGGVLHTFVLSVFVFLLGIVMSLTPCIYPMIPITLSIVRGQNASSRSDLIKRALAYVGGIATTFAILGMLAASGALVFGSLLGNTYFLIGLVLTLGYMTGGMIGFWELGMSHMRSFSIKLDSIFALFVYGMFSGTVTSPCVSPGLLTLLTLVAKTKSLVQGFMYLFIFGLGMGMPLCILAVAFNSVNILPRSGYWMGEVKRAIGILMLFVWFSYIRLLLPFPFAHGLLVFAFLVLGIVMMYAARERAISSSMRVYRFFVAALCFCALGGGVRYITKEMYTYQSEVPVTIYHSIQDGKQIAISQRKKLLVDFGAQWCSACKDFQKKCFYDKAFWKHLERSFIAVEIDCTKMNETHVKEILEKYTIQGFPSLIVVDPETEELLHRFEGDDLEGSREEIAERIRTADI